MYNYIVFLFLIITTIFYYSIMSKKLSESSTYLFYLICISPFIIFYILQLLFYLKNKCKKKDIHVILEEDNNI